MKTIGTILLILGIGALLAWAGSSHGATWQGIPVFAVCVLFSFGLNALVFVHAWVRQTEHFFDLTGSTTYVLVILLANALTESDSARSILLSLMVGYLLSVVSMVKKEAKVTRVEEHFNSKESLNLAWLQQLQPEATILWNPALRNVKL